MACQKFLFLQEEFIRWHQYLFKEFQISEKHDEYGQNSESKLSYSRP